MERSELLEHFFHIPFSENRWNIGDADLGFLKSMGIYEIAMCKLIISQLSAIRLLTYIDDYFDMVFCNW